MPKNSTLSRLERLELLASRLRVDEPIVLHEIATEFGVSMSTINRDVRLLRDRGIPIETDRGRGGGTRVNSSWGIGKVNLTSEEAVDLLVGMATVEKMELPLTFGNSKSIRTKLVSSFSKNDQTKVKKLASRIKVGPTSSPQVISTYRPEVSNLAKKIQQSFALMLSSEISYRSGSGAISTRMIEPHYMVLNHPVWYLISWDFLRNDVRTFRCDRILKMKSLELEFNLRGR